MSNRLTKNRRSNESKAEKWLLYLLECNRKHLYGSDIDDLPTELYCTINDKVVGIPICEFLLLGEYSCYIARGVGTAETAKYYLHKQIKQVYELYDSDYTEGKESCRVEPVDRNPSEVIAFIKEQEFPKVNIFAHRWLAIESLSE